MAMIATLAVTAPALRADPKDDIQAAVQKLADSPSYSWSSSVSGGMGRGTQEGKTEKDGYTTVTLQLRDTSFDIALKGVKAVVKTDSGWKTTSEVMSDEGSDNAGGPPGPEFFAAIIARNFKTPVQQALDNIDALSNIQKTDDGYSADLSEDAIKAMVARPRPRAAATTNPDAAATSMPSPNISNASGSVKIALSNGNLTQIVVHVTATITINGNDRDIDRTTTTTFKDVGSTTVDVPDDAKAKLAS
jgi:hypothetical protein